MNLPPVSCPGCGLRRPADPAARYDGYFNTSPECWAVFQQVMAVEFGAVVFCQVHQLSVDAYAVQHAGAGHPDKSVAVHLAGLHLALVQGLPPIRVAPLLQRLARRVEEWPHFEPPPERGAPTALDVARAAGPAEL